MKEFKASIAINAPAQRIWDILVDGSKWTDWNPTVTKFEGSIGLGIAHAGMPRSYFFRAQWFF